MPPPRGLLIAYTGQGKGKTTAALGLVIRAVGQGLPAAVIQFVKARQDTGEARFFKEKMAEVPFLLSGTGFSWQEKDEEKAREAARAGWEKAREILGQWERGLLVLDELTYPVNRGFLDQHEVVEALKNRACHLHVVVTGRHMGELLLAAADLATEMREIKHPFREGVAPQPGIEF